MASRRASKSADDKNATSLAAPVLVPVAVQPSSISPALQHLQADQASDFFDTASTATTASLNHDGDDIWDETDSDSAYEADSASSYGSLTSEVREYNFENGRRYHGYKAGRYMMPNDEPEMDREDMKHHISMLITEGQLHLAPIGPNPQNILDIGTGTGIWAIDVADAYPSAKVIATDLSPIQPAWIPPNLMIEIDDAEDDWLYKPSTFDLVHCRYLFHGIRNWPRLLSQAMTSLQPGGYVELVEFHVIPTSPDNTLPENSQIMELYNVLSDIGSKIGIDLAVAEKFPRMMEEAGFEEVKSIVYDLPLGDWMESRRMKEVGSFQRFQMTEGLHAMGYGLLTRVAGWAPEKVEVFLAGVRSEMQNRRVHSMYKIYLGLKLKIIQQQPFRLREKATEGMTKAKSSRKEQLYKLNGVGKEVILLIHGYGVLDGYGDLQGGYLGRGDTTWSD